MSAATHTLFLHVASAMTVFGSLGLELAALVAMPRASTLDEAKRWFGVGRGVALVSGPALLVTLVTGAALVSIESWSWSTPWIDVGLGSIVLLAAIGGALTGPKRAAMRRLLAAEGAGVTDTLRTASRHPLLWTSLLARTGVTLGVVWQMTTRPARAPGLVAAGVFLAVGILASLPAWRARR